MPNSRKLEDLTPTTERLCREFIAECRKAGIEVIITSTYRPPEEQTKLYAQGRTAPGPIVTNAKAGQSFHNYRCAFDFVPIVNGKADYATTTTFTTCGHIAEKIGLEWAGRWTKFKELAHCQYTGGLTLKQLQAGVKPQ